jgi:hypothetical protein
MAHVCRIVHGLRILEFEAEGPLLKDNRDVADFLSAAWAHEADLVVLPAERLADDFFRLRTGVAGAVLQKFVTYSMRVAILGDISARVAESSALRDFVLESNRGQHVWFVEGMDDLERRLGEPGA